ncbi:hypothetical protein HRR80_003343 [Exophiala dermatitidis]|uniref:Uncharacterized protein n=1 Tax=Exophiala dermatitidis TaxID=5970 RepID=A0AAN6EYM5_EXODE|nr:hypothetical protein HRR80_003343 [Exophiala dermatitidis]
MVLEHNTTPKLASHRTAPVPSNGGVHPSSEHSPAFSAGFSCRRSKPQMLRGLGEFCLRNKRRLRPEPPTGSQDKDLSYVDNLRRKLDLRLIFRPGTNIRIATTTILIAP